MNINRPKLSFACFPLEETGMVLMTTYCSLLISLSRASRDLFISDVHRDFMENRAAVLVGPSPTWVVPSTCALALVS